MIGQLQDLKNRIQGYQKPQKPVQHHLDWSKIDETVYVAGYIQYTLDSSRYMLGKVSTQLIFNQKLSILNDPGMVLGVI